MTVASSYVRSNLIFDKELDKLIEFVNKTKYGWFIIPENKTVVHNSPNWERVFKQYTEKDRWLQTPEEYLKSKVGNCWEVAFLFADRFSHVADVNRVSVICIEYGPSGKSYFIQHLTTAIKFENKIYLVDTVYKDDKIKCIINKFTNLNNVIDYLKSKYISNNEEIKSINTNVDFNKIIKLGKNNNYEIINSIIHD